MKLKRLANDKEDNKKKKSVALKFVNIKYMVSEDKNYQRESNKNMEIMFKKFKEFSKTYFFPKF